MFNLIEKDFIAGWMFLIGVVLIIPFISMIAMWAMMDDFGGVIIGVFTFIVMALCIASSFTFLGFILWLFNFANDNAILAVSDFLNQII